jgi:hypothetical protein
MRTKNLFINLTILLASLFSFSLAGCDAIYDDGGECPVEPTTYAVRFTYDMNMEFADAFNSEVQNVCLMLFDDNFSLVWRGTESGAALQNEDYEMELPADRIEPGVSYHMLAWCTPNEKDTYTIETNGRAGGDTDDYFYCSMNAAMATADTDEDEPHLDVNTDIDVLFHGYMDEVSFTADPGHHVVTLPLMKDTNRVRVVLQHMSGEPIDGDKFDFEIKADDAVLNYRNTVESGHKVVYHPWHTSIASADITTDTETRLTGVLNVVVAELTVSRLVMEDNPRLVVTNKDTGKVIFSIPIIDYALMVKGYENGDMSDQEFLDREDDYNMTFFLDENDRWINTFLYINSWKVILQNNSLSSL